MRQLEYTGVERRVYTQLRKEKVLRRQIKKFMVLSLLWCGLVVLVIMFVIL